MFTFHNSVGNTSPDFHLTVLSAAIQCQRDISFMTQHYQAQPETDITFFWSPWQVMSNCKQKMFYRTMAMFILYWLFLFA